MARRIKGKGVDQTISMPFRVTTGQNFSSSASTQVVTAYDLTYGNLGARISAIAICYEFFRISNLKVTSFVNAGFLTYDTVGATKVGIVNGLHWVGFDPEADVGTGAVTSYTQASQFPHFNYGNIRERLTFRVGPKGLYLATPLKWYHTATTGSIAADAASAGCIYYGSQNDIATGSPPTQQLLIEGTIQFKGQVTPTLSAIENLLKPVGLGDEEEDPYFEPVEVKSMQSADLQSMSSAGSVRKRLSVQTKIQSARK